MSPRDRRTAGLSPLHPVESGRTAGPIGMTPQSAVCSEASPKRTRGCFESLTGEPMMDWDAPPYGGRPPCSRHGSGLRARLRCSTTLCLPDQHETWSDSCGMSSMKFSFQVVMEHPAETVAAEAQVRHWLQYYLHYVLAELSSDIAADTGQPMPFTLFSTEVEAKCRRIPERGTFPGQRTPTGWGCTAPARFRPDRRE